MHPSSCSRRVAIHHIFFKPAIELEITLIEAEVAVELQVLAKRLGSYERQPNGEWDQTSKVAFEALINNENLEERWSRDLDPDVIE